MDGLGLRVRIDDEERLAALRLYGILDTKMEPRYERLSEMLRTACRAAWATITFVDRDRQWFKARSGCEATETPRRVSFCSVSMLQTEPLIVGNALLDPRFCNNPTVVGRPYVRFYAGFPIFSREGYGLGSVCVNDTKPRMLLAEQIALLEKGRDWVQADLELRRIEQALTGKKLQVGAAAPDESLRAYAALRADQVWDELERAASRTPWAR